MPHVIVKLWPGKTAEQKHRLSEAIVRDVTSILSYGDESVSVAFEEVSSRDWSERVFEPEILGKWDMLTKEPGYGRRPPPTEARKGNNLVNSRHWPRVRPPTQGQGAA